MPSSTSSSRPESAQKRLGWADQRIPNVPWKKTWILAAVFFLVWLGLIETFGRTNGFRPSLRDNSSLWNRAREMANVPGRQTLAIVGSSRAQLGLDLDFLGAEYKQFKAVQLGIAGTSSLEVVEHLAADPGFQGDILFEVNPNFFFFTDQCPLYTNRAKEKIVAFENRSAWEPFDHRLMMFFQENFTFGLPQLSPLQLAKGRKPAPDIFHLRRDRWQQASYRELTDQKKELRRVGQRKHYTVDVNPIAEKHLQELVDRLQKAQQQLQDHGGGKIAMLRMPSAGEILQCEEQTCPRREYWDQLTARLGYAHVHFSDMKEIRSIECPDETHIDHRDGKQFTRALFQHLSNQDFPSS